MLIDNDYDNKMDSRLQINVAIVGSVAVGKSTFLNSLFANQYADMSVKNERTTMCPNIYHETSRQDRYVKHEKIIDMNKRRNETVKQKMRDGELKEGDILECEYFVPQIKDFVNRKSGLWFSVWDIPGLNDSEIKDYHYAYLKKHFHKFNIVFFLIDNMNGLARNDDMTILKTLVEQILYNRRTYGINTKLFILMNKCDDMSFDSGKNGLFVLEDYTQKIYEDTQLVIDRCMSNYEDKVEYKFLPYSCENTLMYRLCKMGRTQDISNHLRDKLGYNEYGRRKWDKLGDEEKDSKLSQLLEKEEYDVRLYDSGYNVLKHMIDGIMDGQSQYNYMLDHVKYDMINMILHPSDCQNDLNKFGKLYGKIKRLNKKYKKFNVDDKLFINIFVQYMNNYIGSLLSDMTIGELELVKYNFDNVYQLFDKSIWKTQVGHYMGIKKDIEIKYVNMLEQFDITLKDMFNILDNLVDINNETLFDNIYKILIRLEHYTAFNISVDDILSVLKKIFGYNIDSKHQIIIVATLLGKLYMYPRFFTIYYDTLDYNTYLFQAGHYISTIEYNSVDNVAIQLYRLKEIINKSIDIDKYIDIKFDCDMVLEKLLFNKIVNNIEKQDVYVEKVKNKYVDIIIEQ